MQGKLREEKREVRTHEKTKKNPLKNKVAMQRLNPYSKTALDLEKKASADRVKARKAALAKKRSKAGRAEKSKRTKRFGMLADGLEESFKDAQKIIEDEIKAGQYRGDDESEEEEDDN